MKRTIIIFGSLILALLLLFRLSKFAILSGTTRNEYVIAFFAILFFAIGLYINKKRSIENEPDARKVNETIIKELALTTREYEILCEIEKGYSNKEISDRLNVSESTIKTHISNLFSKLGVKRRTQAVQYAKELNIL